MTIDITISTQRTGTAVIEPIEDLDVLSESAVCACSAGDDNPF